VRVRWPDGKKHLIRAWRSQISEEGLSEGGSSKEGRSKLNPEQLGGFLGVPLSRWISNGDMVLVHSCGAPRRFDMPGSHPRKGEPGWKHRKSGHHKATTTAGRCRAK
jgi:hypothetical protein